MFDPIDNNQVHFRKYPTIVPDPRDDDGVQFVATVMAVAARSEPSAPVITHKPREVLGAYAVDDGRPRPGGDTLLSGPWKSGLPGF